ncbi:MAG: Two component transcriptional regulator, winged helix family [Synergistales bacterium 53_16]|jgi:two-component system response regulator CpxR|nr:MAG: Two component transcriptional regulator, winged helix family [Synergistales bacterium 53_16]
MAETAPLGYSGYIKGGPPGMERILIIEDDRELCDLLHEYLEAEGFCLDSAHDGRKGLEAARNDAYALVILDVMLPGMSGLDVLRELRKESNMPVLMLTARGDDVDRIVGLELGADDYLPKPFNPRELLARIRAVLRRGAREDGASGLPLFAVGGLELDPASRTVRLYGKNIFLTTVEFSILEILLRSAGRLVAREELVPGALKRVYSPFDRSIDVHISNLRKKIGPYPDGSERIKTLRGEGYLFAYPPEGEK